MTEPCAEEPTLWTIAVGEETTSALFERAPAATGNTVIVLGHGAGSHREHRTVSNLAAQFLSRGFHVVRFNFLYSEKKKGPPDRMPRLMECFRAVVERVRQEARPDRLVIGGHSMGGRAASMMAADGFACDGLLLLAYPLHPAGKPEKLRDAHLPQITTPTLCLNGTRDELCDRNLMECVVRKLPSTWTMHWLEGADHSFHVRKRSGRTDEDVLNEIGQRTREWMEAR
ncbi:MAG: alpha/beta fold hydrolase [Armatimonadota bacterium]|nr:alpha/beta fold hydrolase [Armatimonadota bacterium]